MKKALRLEKVPQWALFPVLNAIPFFREVLKRDPDQITYIVRHSAVQEVGPNEVLIRQGEIDNSVFFVLMGDLQVFSGANNRFPVDTIRSGDTFGEIAMITNLERTSTITGDPNSRRILVMKTDFSPFGEVRDIRRISLETKLAFYREIVNVIQRRVDNFIRQFPEFSVDHDEVKPVSFEGRKASLDEVVFYYERARRLALCLMGWNTQLATTFNAEGMPQQSGIKVMMGLLDRENGVQAKPGAPPSLPTLLGQPAEAAAKPQASPGHGGNPLLRSRAVTL